MHQKNIPENIWLAAGDGDLQSVTLFVDGRGLSPNVPDEHTYTPMYVFFLLLWPPPCAYIFCQACCRILRPR